MSHYRWLVPIVILFAGGWLVWRWVADQSFSWDLFRQTFASLNPLWLLISSLLALASYWGRALRWREMLRPMKDNVGIASLTKATMIGFTAAVLLGRAGEFVRPYLIAREQKVSLSSQLGIWLLERVADFIALLIFFGLALAVIGDVDMKGGMEMRRILRTGGVVMAAMGVGGIVLIAIFRRFSTPDPAGDVHGKPPPARIRHFFRSFAGGMEATRNWSLVRMIALYTTIEWIIIAGFFYAALKSFPDTAGMSLADTLTVLGFVSIGSVVQAPGIGGGMQLTAIVVLRQLYGLPVEAATAVATILWFVSYGVVVPFGLALSIKSGLRLRQIVWAAKP